MKILTPAVLLVAALLAQTDDFLKAIQDRDVAKVKQLLMADPKLVHKRYGNNYTPLHIAANNGYTEVARVLLDAKADVNARADDDHTPLYVAMFNAHEKVTALLLERGADVNARTKFDQFTPLHRAAQHNNTAIVKMLLAKGADPDGGWKEKVSNPAYAPLHFAAGEGNIDVARLLLAKGSRVNAMRFGFRRTPLYDALEHRDKDMVKLLLAKGADPEADNSFGEALRWGQRDVVEWFLAKGIDGTQADWLVSAVASGKKDIVELILARGGDVNRLDRAGTSALVLAARLGHTELVELLLEKGADPTRADSQGFTALHEARTKKVAGLLLTKGAKVNARANNAKTPMYYAVQRGDLETAAFMEAKGADHDLFTLAALGRVDELQKELLIEKLPKDLGFNELSPLHLAARHGKVKAAEVLLAKGAKVNEATWNGYQPLHQAAAAGQVAIIELLLEKKADINAKGGASAYEPRAATPLEMALNHGQVEAVVLLRKAGALPKLDGPKELARWLAVAGQKRHLGLIKYLVDEGAALDAKIPPDDRTVLHVAAAVGDIDLLKYLVAKGIKIQDKTPAGHNALHFAVEGGHKAMVAFLLDKGVSVKDTAYPPLHTAVMRGDLEIAALLLARGADVNQVFTSVVESTALGEAARAGKLEAVKFLLTKGADVKKDPAALHRAAFHGHAAIVALLLERGLAVDAFLPDGFELYYFPFQRRIPILAVFVEKDKTKFKGQRSAIFIRELNGEDQVAVIGGQPLQAAIAGRQAAVVDLLLKKGAKADVRFPDGSTPLHLAAMLDDVATVKLLLASGVDVNVRNQAGKTALQCAMEYEADEVAALLRKHGAKE
jgi:ankyrin repeat protein